MMSGIQQTLCEANVILIALPKPSTETAYDYLRHIIVKRLVDGVILTAIAPIDPRIHLLQSANMPFISIGRIQGQTSALWADLDYATTAQLAVERLVSHGHRTIATVLPAVSNQVVHHYLEGFKRGLEMFNIAFQPELVITQASTEMGGALAADLVTASPLKPTATVLLCDLMTFGFHRRMQETRHRADERIALIGIRRHHFQDILSPSLTCFQIDTAEFAGSIGRLMLSQLPGLHEDYSYYAQNVCHKLVLVPGLSDGPRTFATA